MRTTRVNSVPSSIFRNKRQYLHSNELFQRVLDEGQHFSQQQRKKKDKNNQPNQNPSRTPSRVILNRTSKAGVIKGLSFGCDEILVMQNSLLERSSKISKERSKKLLLKSYRSSI